MRSVFVQSALRCPDLSDNHEGKPQHEQILCFHAPLPREMTGAGRTGAGGTNLHSAVPPFTSARFAGEVRSRGQGRADLSSVFWGRFAAEGGPETSLKGALDCRSVASACLVARALQLQGHLMLLRHETLPSRCCRCDACMRPKAATLADTEFDEALRAASR